MKGHLRMSVQVLEAILFCRTDTGYSRDMVHTWPVWAQSSLDQAS